MVDVKTFLAIGFSLMLAVLQIFAAPPVTSCTAPGIHHDCGCGGKMACCAARQSAPVPVDTTLTQANSLEAVFVPVLASHFLVLPSTEASFSDLSVSLVSLSSPSPLFLRNCALLI